jgi:hypothetical protein
MSDTEFTGHQARYRTYQKQAFSDKKIRQIKNLLYIYKKNLTDSEKSIPDLSDTEYAK